MRISDWSSDVCSSDLNREWVVARRARTKHLIELGGLVAKARLVELADDDRALLYGAFLDLAQQFHSADGDALKLRLKRRGTRPFPDEAETASHRRPSGRRQDGTGARKRKRLNTSN